MTSRRYKILRAPHYPETSTHHYRTVTELTAPLYDAWERLLLAHKQYAPRRVWLVDVDARAQVIWPHVTYRLVP